MRTLVSFPLDALKDNEATSRKTSGQMLLAAFTVLVLGVSTLIVGLSLEVLEHTASTFKIVMHGSPW